MQSLWKLFFAGALALQAGLGWAEPAPGHFTEARGMGAVGRLDFGALAFCTGVMISERLVLTAAHCLYAPDGTGYSIGQIRFLAGVRQGRALASAGVLSVYLHPFYRAETKTESEAVSSPEASLPQNHDLAVLVLDRSIQDPRIRPFDLGAPPLTGERVSVVSYAYDRPDAPMIEDSCLMLEQQAGLLVLSCDVEFGGSGAPVLMRGDGRMRLVSLIAAKAEAEGRKVALGVPLEAQLAKVLALVPDNLRPAESDADQGLPSPNGAN